MSKEFSTNQRKRIVKAVQAVLDAPTQNGNVRRPAFPRGRSEFFWATLSNEVVANTAYTYDWTEIAWPGGSAVDQPRHGGATGGGFPQISTPNHARMTTSLPALVMMSVTGSTPIFTIIAEDQPLQPGTRIGQVLQVVAIASGTNKGRFDWDMDVVHPDV